MHACVLYITFLQSPCNRKSSVSYVLEVGYCVSVGFISGHKDSVTQVSFSADGTYLATGDMSGFIQVWNIATKETVWSFEVADLEVR